MTRGSLRRGAVAAVLCASMALAGICVVPGMAASAATATMAAGPGCAAPTVGQVSCGALMTPGSSAVTSTALAKMAGVDAAAAAPPGLAPVDLRGAYGLWASALNGGVGQTVAVVTAYDDTSSETDLDAYRSQYNLPACTTANKCFSKVDQNGGTTYPAAGPAGWPLASAQSLDMISAICPNCHILLVEANSPAITDVGQAENEAVALGAKFVTNTWLTPEATFTTSEPGYDSSYFDHPGVEITAPAGNAGYTGGTFYPAASPDVIAVGGTTLTRSAAGARYWTETAWAGSGSGCSAWEAKPTWQTDSGCAGRMLNDAAAVADPNSSPAFYDTASGGWVQGGGTTVAAAIVAAALALGGAPAAGTSGASYLFAHPSDFYDTTTGSNGTCSPAPAYYCTTGTGYDGPSGLGTPDGGIGPRTPDKSQPGAQAIYNPVTGDLEVFGVSSSRALVERHWHPGDGWSGWQVLGGSTLAGGPAAIYDPASGYVEVYGRTTVGTVQEFWWNPATGWHGPTDLGGSVTGDPAAVYNPITGSLEIWAVGTGGTMQEDGWVPVNGWSGWQNRGGSVTDSVSAIYNPGSGNMDYYAAGAGTGSLEQLYWNPSSGFNWNNLGGLITSPTAVYNPVSGGLEVYAVNGSGGAVYEDNWHPVQGWSGFQSRGGTILYRPAVHWNPISGNMEVYGLNSSDALMEDFWNASSGWSGWQSRGGAVNSSTGLYNPGSGNLEIYALGTNGTLYEDFWNPSKGWSGWLAVGSTLIDL